LAGIVQAQSDGLIQAHLSLLLVARPDRRKGLGRSLLRQAFRATGAIRLDLVSQCDPFYERLGGDRLAGFRVRGEDLP
jgi:ribosomal protein S18 acetylase RimI-like enzyme